ncbi:unnamed protein product [Alternaria alternata]
MKAYKPLFVAALGTLVTSERSVSSPESPLVNISSLNTADQDTYPADITIASGTNPDQLVHTSAIKDIDWDKSVCRGRKLLLAMTRDASQGTRYINPLFTPWDGDLEKEMVEWGWDNWQEHKGWCNFKDNGLSPALKALGISDQHVDDKGDNQCWVANHFDGPGVLFNPDDPDDIDDSDDEMLAMDDQYYMDPNGQRKRCTGASYAMGINVPASVLYFISRTGPLEAAKWLWERTPQSSELPNLRTSSDLAWSLWHKIMWPDHPLSNIRKIFSLYITNEETNDIVERALGIGPTDDMKKWPGVSFDSTSEEGLAILGSANGRAVGYFLAQHKHQLGGDKYVSKMTVFEDENEGNPHATILFWIDDVPSPPPELPEPGAPPGDHPMDTSPGMVQSKVVRRRDHGRSITRKHVIWVGPE